MRFALTVMSVVLAPFVASAAAYGTAGCGLGSIVFGDSSGIVQIFAATTNGTSGTQTFGITSGTSNCVDGGGAQAALDQKAFMNVNYASVTRDAAKGEGEYLAAFATLLQCDAESRPAFYQLAQSQHAQIFATDATPDQALTNVKAAMVSHPTLKDHCTRL